MGPWQGTAIRDQIQERISGQQSRAHSRLTLGGKADDEDEDCYFDDYGEEICFAEDGEEYYYEGEDDSGGEGGEYVAESCYATDEEHGAEGGDEGSQKNAKEEKEN